MNDKTPELIKELQEIIDKYCYDTSIKIKVNDVLQEVEYSLKIKFIRKAKSLAEAARLLNIKRTTLCMYLKKVCLNKWDIKSLDFEL